MLSGRYVVVQIDGAGQKTQLGLKEVKAFGHLANGKKKGHMTLLMTNRRLDYSHCLEHHL